MKRFRPYCAGYIILYVLVVLSGLDAGYTVYRQVKGINDAMSGFSMFSYIIFAMALLYAWNYIRAQVAFDGHNMRVAYPANIRPKQGEPRAMILYRQGDLDMKFIDKTIDLTTLTRYGYVEDLGYERIDRSGAGENSKLYPVHEVAFITSDNKRYHMNAAIYSPKQQKAIFEEIRKVSGVEPEGKLKEALGNRQ